MTTTNEREERAVEGERDLVDALRRAHEGEPVPSFVATLAAARSRHSRRWVGVVALASAAAAVAFALARPIDGTTPSASERGIATLASSSAGPYLASTSLTLPSDFLLDVPGQELLGTTPSFKLCCGADALSSARNESREPRGGNTP